MYFRSEDDHSAARNIAVAGMAALLFAGHPQMALAKDAPLQGQVSTGTLRSPSSSDLLC